MAKTRADSQKPLIGVTGNAKYWSPSWFALSSILRCCGARAKRISIRHGANINRLDALIISGGDDIHPSLYGEQEMPKAKYDQPRDELEIHYIRYALEKNLPMLGICRGYQLLNVVCGGTLYDDIRPMRQQTSNFNTVLPRKTAYLAKNTQLCQLINQSKIQINSLHHQAIFQVAPEFKVAATDKDDFIQAIEDINQHTMLGVQWHPEYLFYRHNQRLLFHWLITQAKLYRQHQ